MTTGDGPARGPIRIGSRGSALALVQAHWTADRLRVAGCPAEIVVIRTAGDDREPDTAWGEGAFVGAIEAALLDGRIDVAVHSAKDVPTDEDPRLVIAAWTAREDPRDALVCRVRGTTLATLPSGSRVGTDSPRRGAFLQAVRPDLRIHPLSGNVDTRLAKLEAGATDALVLAVAGLTRLGRADRIDDILALDVAVPAPGQGILALQARAGDLVALPVLAALDDPASRFAAEAERTFLKATGGGCRSPIGALATVDEGTLTLRVAAERALQLPDGSAVRGGIVRLAISGPSGTREDLANDLAARVVRLRERPRVLVTRPSGGADETLDALAVAGLDAVPVPAIELRDEPPGDGLDAAMASAAAAGAWVVPTSPNGVRVALEALERVAVAPAAVRWAVVGRGSAALLQRIGIEPFVPSRPVGAALGAELPLGNSARVVLVRSNIADRGLVMALADRGASVEDVVGYRTCEGPESSLPALAAALDGPLDAIAFASGSAVRGLLALAPPGMEQRLLLTPVICIGPSSAAVAHATGFATVVEAADTSPAALVAAVAATLAATLLPVPVDAEAAVVAGMTGTENAASTAATAPGGTA